MSRVLVCGDPHEPVSHLGCRAFCKGLRRKYKTNKT